MLGPYNIEAIVIDKQKIILDCSGDKTKQLRDKLSKQLSQHNPRLAQQLAGCAGCTPRKDLEMEMPENFAVSTREDVAELTVYRCAVMELILSPGGIELDDAPPCLTDRTVEA